jgi:hypothetical protein
MSELSPSAEREIKQLDLEDDEAGVWEREPYQRRLLALFSSLREMNQMMAKLAGLPRPVRPLRVLRRLGLLEHCTPRMRKWGGPRRKADRKVGPLDFSLDIVVDDARRIKDMRRDSGRKQQRRDDKETAELVAAERHVRFMHGGMIGEGEEWEAERHMLIDKVHRRLKGSGTTGAERNKRAKMRAK